ncbi:MAG: hypothetical protein JZU50_13615 [Desulfobulbaceae bacterium]|nr:hypothetical protein [Desulfobulbaceae bacterium]
MTYISSPILRFAIRSAEFTANASASIQPYIRIAPQFQAIMRSSSQGLYNDGVGDFADGHCQAEQIDTFCPVNSWLTLVHSIFEPELTGSPVFYQPIGKERYFINRT